MRGALFNALGDISSLRVLDCFGGSGALSFEAISRGASGAVVVEIDKIAHQTITNNIKELDLQDLIKAIRANISGWSDNNPAAQFDLVLCDPPYDKLNVSLLNKLSRHINPGGVLVLSLPSGQTAEFPDSDLQTLSSSSYGDAQLVFYRRIA